MFNRRKLIIINEYTSCNNKIAISYIFLSVSSVFSFILNTSSFRDEKHDEKLWFKTLNYKCFNV